MSVTAQLLELFRVDKQVRGLRSRLDAAERFLAVQEKLLEELDVKNKSFEAQARQTRAAISNEEGEAARLDAKIASLREQMNKAKTAKEYNAFLNELANLKEQKTAMEEAALGAMTKGEELEGQLKLIVAQREERRQIVATARADRDAREAEIRDRLAELNEQRGKLAELVPPKVRGEFERLIEMRGDEAMAAVEVIDRRNHEYSCSACMIAIPIERVSSLMSGHLTKCPNCMSILFNENENLLQQPKSTKSKKATAAGA